MADTEVKNGVPKTFRLKGYDLRYLCGKDKVLFENGVYISRKDFDAIKGTPSVVKETVDRIAVSEPQYCGFDWAYACTTGNLRRKKRTANLEANSKTEKRRERMAQQVNEASVEEQKKAAVRQYVFSSAFLVMIVMAIVGLGSAVMSAYHTSTFLYESGKPAWASVITGTMLILFSGTAFTAARYFFQEKGTLCVFGWFFVVAGLAVIVYSMFSTLTVNFNQFKWREDERTAVTVADSEALSTHNRIIEEYRSALDKTDREITRLEGEADYWRTQSWQRYDRLNEQLTAASERQGMLRAEMVRLETERPALMEQAAVSRDTIYSFLARLLKLPEDTARFFIYVVPACLYDILAPFALSVVLLLIDRSKKQVEEVSRC
jgi:hypothetical protein